RRPGPPAARGTPAGPPPHRCGEARTPPGGDDGRGAGRPAARARGAGAPDRPPPHPRRRLQARGPGTATPPAMATAEGGAKASPPRRLPASALLEAARPPGAGPEIGRAARTRTGVPRGEP